MQVKTDLSLVDTAEELATQGKYPQARIIYDQLLVSGVPKGIQSRIENGLGVIAAAEGHPASSRLHFNRGLKAAECELVHRNQSLMIESFPSQSESVKVAILSLLFNWPSTGGGTVHTWELAECLQKDGYQVKHFYAVNESFGVGKVTEDLNYDSCPLQFSESEWNAAQIRYRFQSAVKTFAPDWVIVTDSWNTKPLLVEAVRDYPYFIRIAAEECLCPLNNVRMLFGESSDPGVLPPILQCDQHQLESPQICRDCVKTHSSLSGGLHRAERVLSGFEAEEYPDRLQQSFAEAEGVLVVNPSIAELIKPYTPAVHVVPSGFDTTRFPLEYSAPPFKEGQKVRILFAGLCDELMKGFHVLHAAAAQLWELRQDFELWITREERENDPDYFRSIGWQSQKELTQTMCQTDLLVFPTVAQEALGRSAVEAMGCGRPVIASRIGGLEWVIDHEQTGLLFAPGDVEDLCRQLQRLLDDNDLRVSLGKAGLKKFRSEFTWDAVMGRSYRPLLGTASKTEV